MLYRCVLLAFVLCFLSLSQAAAQTTVAWVDAQGAPAPHYLEGGRAYVQVAYRDTWLDPGAPDSIAVDLAAQQSGDTEAFSLTETGPDTGVFAGSVQLRSAAATPWDGILQTLQSATAPYAHDTIAATLLLPEGTFTASKGLIGSLTTFLDEWGRPATQYAVRTAAYVRVEDQNRNRPGLYDFTTVTLTSAGTGDVETLALVETTKDSGVFEGSIPVRDFVQQNQDGKLDINLSDQIEVRHEDLSGPTESTDTAGIIPILLILLDEEGRPATAWLDGGMGRARVVNHALGGLDQLTVWLRSLTAGDFQQFHLPLTSPGSGIYEGTFRLATAPAVFGNGRVETASGGDTVEVEDLSSGMKLSVPVIGSRVLFLDAFGRVTDRYVPGDSIRVRVLAPSLNDPLLRDAAPVLLKQGTEQEGIQLQETGFDTGIFEGAIPSVAGTPIPGNGTLEVDFGLDVEAEFPNLNFPDPSTARARMVGAAIHFADAQGQPVERFLESSRAYVRVTYRGFGSPTSLDTLSVDLAASLTGDTEFISLTETGEDTGVFLGAIPLRLGSSTSGDGILQTAEAPGPPYELDTLTAQLYVPEGLFTATAGLTGSRTAFVDAYGREVETYPVGSRVHVRVEDQNYNRQGLWDTVQVLLRGQGNGDEEELTLQETTRDSGVYEGSIGTLGAASADRDGVFQVDGGEAIEVTHEDFLGGTESFDRAAIGFAGV
ncbi:MAG TPA: hypothetical protein VHN15_11610, partial [Thermoanaerobaculia bacterium]|nr:hypothetical protein [Thermoanaerobaculia bacterium]